MIDVNVLKQTFFGLSAIWFMLGINVAYAYSFGDRYCNQKGYHCISVKKNQSWHALFKNEQERDLVMRLNRMNTALRPGMRIAIPDNLSVSLIDISPLPHEITAPGVNTIVVNQQELAWGAYDPNGKLLKWGPISGGRSYCPDIKSSCRTINGTYTVYTKRGSDCTSKKFPIGKGGAKMPYCMFFKGGYALHGSSAVPGYHASHGCVRMLTSDAKWLNQNFVKVGSTRVVVSSAPQKEGKPAKSKSKK